MGELGARADAELREHMREMSFDRALGEEERRSDLAIRLPLGDERGDSFLGGSERARGRGASTDPPQLATRPLGPERCADRLEDAERLLQRLARLPPALRATLSGAVREERPRAIERELSLRVPLERLFVRRRALRRARPTARRAARGTEGRPQPPTRARAAARSPRTSRAARPLPPSSRARRGLRSGRRRSGRRPARQFPLAARRRRPARATRLLRRERRARARDVRAPRGATSSAGRPPVAGTRSSARSAAALACSLRPR